MRRNVSAVTILALALTAVVLWPADAAAQRGRGPVRVSSARVVRAYYYRPYYYYQPYYGSFYWGSPFWGSPWSPYGFYPSVWYGQYRPYRYAYDEASLRVQVTPKQAQVYLDGYFVGTVDSFDGTFQRLHLSPGEHVVEIFMDGYRTIRETMRFSPREGYQIKRVMEPLGPGEPAAERPRPDPSARRSNPQYPGDARRERPERPEEMREPPPGAGRSEGAGSVAIRVRPGGATVLVDGEKWEAPDDQDRLVIQLGEGPHRIEIQKAGYRTFTTEIRVRRGETVPLNVSLRTSGMD